MKPGRVLARLVPALFLIPSSAAAQSPTAPIDLATLQEAAVAADPRSGEFDLLSRQTDVRLRNIAVTRLPMLSVEGQAQYQSDVPTAPLRLPGGQPLFSPPKATYDSFLRVEQRLFDPVRGPQSALERAQLGEQQARLRTALFGLRQQVNDAFFAAALLQERETALRAAMSDLESRLEEARARVAQGTALPSESATVEAALLQRQQDRDELAANRRAALAVLSKLTDREIAGTETLALPEPSARVVEARRAPSELRARPEHEQFARAGERIARQQEVALAQEQPRINSFARIGYGRPGLNFINDEFDSYALGGVQIQWRAWTWKAADREHEALRLQQQIVAADQAAFAKGLSEAIASDEASIDRLRDAVDTDARIIALREQIEATARVRLQEGVSTASEYVDRNTELLQARVALVTHRVELAQAGARLLTTLGLEVK